MDRYGIFSVIVLAGLLTASTGLAQTLPHSSPSLEDTVLANRYFAKATDLAFHAKYDSANYYFEKASAIFKERAIDSNDPKLWTSYVKCRNQIGENLRQLAKYFVAKEILRSSLQVGLEKLGKNHPEIAATYNYLCMIHSHLGEFDEALECGEKALTICRNRLGENHELTARSYESLGFAHIFAANPHQALEYFNKSLTIRLHLYGNEDNLQLAASYFGLARAYHYKYDSEEELKYSQKALNIRLKFFGDIHPDVADCYHTIGLSYFDKGEYEKAREYYQRSLAISLSLFGEIHRQVARCYVDIAHTYSKLGDHDKALEYQLKSLPIFQQVFGDNAFFAASHQYIADVYKDKGETIKAQAYYDKSLAIFVKNDRLNHSQVGRIYRSIGELYIKEKDFARALFYLQKSFPTFVSDFSDTNIYHNPALDHVITEFHLLHALNLKAQAFAGLSASRKNNQRDLEMSLVTFQLASDLIDQMRSGYREEGTKLYLGEFAAKIYDQGIQAALKMFELTHDPQYRAQAFFYTEKSKAAVLAQSLQEARAKQFSGIPPDLLEKEKQLRHELDFAETELQKEKQKKTSSAEHKMRELEAQHFTRQTEYDRLLAHFENAYPQYHTLKYKTQTITVANLQSALDDQTAVLEYFVGANTITAFAITHNTFDVVNTNKDTTFNELVSSLSRSFKNVTSKAAYVQTAIPLYKILIAPFAARLVNKPKWVIIPDGDLFQIPFEALFAKAESEPAAADYQKFDYLIKQHELSYHFSTTLFLTALKEQNLLSYPKVLSGFAPVFSKHSNNSSVLVRAQEEFTMDVQDKGDYLVTRDGKTLDELKYSEQELKEIWTVCRRRGEIYLYQNASEENFKKNIKGHKYVHIATHGFINSENPKLSNLAFSQPQNRNAKEDGILFSGETYNLNLDADLLVLSACQTGTGKLVKGEGLMALTRGFLYSGAHNIIASLWKVYDQHTSLLMVEMYRQIAAGKNYAAALREAKLKMIANPETAAPQSWAGFVLIGR